MSDIQANGVIRCDLLDRLTATDRLYGDPVLELGAVAAALAHLGELLSGALPRCRS